MDVITRYHKGKATVSLEQRRLLPGYNAEEHQWKGLKTLRRGVDVYAEETFPAADTDAIRACQDKFYQQMSERTEERRRSLNHPPAAISRSGNKRKD